MLTVSRNRQQRGHEPWGPTSLLFGLEGVRVVDVVRGANRVVQVVIETVDRHVVCPDCGGESVRVKDRPLARIRNLPLANQQVALWWRKRHVVCLASKAYGSAVADGQRSHRGVAGAALGPVDLDSKPDVTPPVLPSSRCGLRPGGRRRQDQMSRRRPPLRGCAA